MNDNALIIREFLTDENPAFLRYAGQHKVKNRHSDVAVRFMGESDRATR